MGNCSSAPKTKEDDNVPEPEPQTEGSLKGNNNEEVNKVEEQEEKTIETTSSDEKKTDAETKAVEDDDKNRHSLGALLNEVHIIFYVFS